MAIVSKLADQSRRRRDFRPYRGLHARAVGRAQHRSTVIAQAFPIVAAKPQRNRKTFVRKALDDMPGCATLNKAAATMPGIESSVIRHISYSAAESVLQVTFVSGRVYLYADVPAELYAALLAAESKGTFFNEEIRDLYPTTRIAGSRGPR